MHWIVDFTGSRAGLERLGGDSRLAVRVYSNNGARSRNHCCRAKAISIKYYECAFVALGTRIVISPSMASPALVLKLLASSLTSELGNR